MPLVKSKKGIQGDTTIQFENNGTSNNTANGISVHDTIDLKTIWVNHDDSRWAYYYTKKEVDALLADKQNKIDFIYLEPDSGDLLPEVLYYLLENPLTQIVHNDIIYKIYSNQDDWVFTSLNVETGTMELLTIDTESGYYWTQHKEITTSTFIKTTEEWNSRPGFISNKGSLYVYSDKYSYLKDGQLIIVPGLKIGSGAYLIDEPFLNEDVYVKLNEHLSDIRSHVSEEDRRKWDNKLNYEEPIDDLLILTRD